MSDYDLEKEVEKATHPTRWWRAVDSNGRLLAGTSSYSDFENLGLLNKPGVKIQRLYEATLSEWRDEVQEEHREV